MLARKITESLYTTIKQSCSPKGNGDEEVAACCPEHGVDDRFQVNRLTAMPGCKRTICFLLGWEACLLNCLA